MNVLLDLDGTLTDPARGITNCIAYALTRNACQLEGAKFSAAARNLRFSARSKNIGERNSTQILLYKTH